MTRIPEKHTPNGAMYGSSSIATQPSSERLNPDEQTMPTGSTTSICGTYTAPRTDTWMLSLDARIGQQIFALPILFQSEEQSIDFEISGTIRTQNSSRTPIMWRFCAPVLSTIGSISNETDVTALDAKCRASVSSSISVADATMSLTAALGSRPSYSIANSSF